ncbi:MAG: single-stranded-DNA-specific exonuclease RecJ [Thermodesulfobacteriota bacterium]|nr:single-stranded-DNA-specific exonuclease RecJ [Thermodesulfobacteriota bacterium]
MKPTKLLRQSPVAITPKTWDLKASSPLVSELSSKTGLTPLQARVLINRGISDKDAVRSFMDPRLADMADPMLLKGMDKVLSTILKAVEKNEKITIYGDYDADGLTATALLLHFFSSLDIPVSSYIPNRFTEGYGLNSSAVDIIAKNGTGLLITVDCGISDSAVIAQALNSGMEVVVTDHHQIPEDYEALCPVINPHQPGCCFPYKELAGVGLAFFLVVALRAALREKGMFEADQEPDLRIYLDLVALGTVGDRVPLLGQNRILVANGLSRIAWSRWAGIEAIKEVSGVNESDITSDDLGFRLAPRLNAPGRMDDPEIGLALLMARDTSVAKNLAEETNSANRHRQRVEQGILEEIEESLIHPRELSESRVLVVAGRDWHQGVLGIVASRLVERYYRPTLVMDIKDGLAVGSGRSIKGFNLYGALCRLSYLLEKFGGHAHAAGFTLRKENIEKLKNGLRDLAAQALVKEDLRPTIKVDGEISLEALSVEIIHQIRALSPFGEGNPEPIFWVRSVDVLDSRIVGERHLKLRVREKQKVFDAIGFGMSGWHPLTGETIQMLFTPQMNCWKGHKSIQLRIVDLKRPVDL